MRKGSIHGIEFEVSSGNVLKLLGLPDASEPKIKSSLAIKIAHAFRRLGLTEQEAAKRMGITQPELSR